MGNRMFDRIAAGSRRFLPVGCANRSVAALLAAVCTCGVAGCATTTVNAQWTDPEFAGRSLRGQNVLVVCDADSPAAKRICLDAFAAQVRSAGAVPVVSAEAVAGPPPTNDKTLAAARAAGAKAILSAVVGQDATYVSPGAGVGVGVGGGSGSRGGVSFGGISVGIPIGGGSVSASYAANLVLTDVAAVKMMWSGKVSTPASQNVNAQLAELARVGVDAAKGAGFF